MLKKLYKDGLIVLLVLAVVVIGTVGSGFVTVLTHQTSSAAVPQPSARLTAVPQPSHYIVNMAKTPAAKTLVQKTNGKNYQKPLLTGVPAAVEAKRKAVAQHNSNAPTAQQLLTERGTGVAANVAPNTSGLVNSFQGQGDTCGCQPPDMALAASPNWVLQGVNTSFAVYSTSGSLQSGWPKTAQAFFGIPNTSCGTTPFLSDPRAFYDPNDQRFFVAMLEVEGAAGISPSCALQSTYWIAVSQTNNPTGTWIVNKVDMTLGQQAIADYTEFGFDAQAVYFSGNMFSTDGNSFLYAETVFGSKAGFENGSVNLHSFTNFQANGVVVDTVQPVMAEAHNYSGPNVGYLINSFNINSGGGQCSTSCSGVVLWAIANPASGTPTISSVIVSTRTYTMPPQADEPGCAACIETLDTRISATPIFRDGLINFALETGVGNGTQTVPGVLWGQILPTVNDAGAITTAAKIQTGILAFHGDVAASFGALMPDADGNLFMVFELMSSTINPKVEYVSRRTSNLAGFFHDTGNTLRVGDAPYTIDTSNSKRWGDYEAASYDGFNNDKVWVAGEFAAANGDWSTWIGSTQMTLTTP